MFRRMRSIAIVGATCPLARHLVDELLARGHAVFGLCRSFQKIPGHWRTDRAFHAAEFRLHNARATAKLLDGSDQIVWLAQSADTDGCDVAALTAVCNSAPVSRKIILISSGGSVYGKPDLLPVPENHPRRPLSPYGEIKRRLEDTLDDSVRRHPGLRGVVLRCGNIYGPSYLSPDAKGCIGAFTRALVAGHRVPIVAGGLAVRDFIHVNDVVKAILSALAWEQRFTVWNVGSGEGTQIAQVLEALCDILGCLPAGFIHRDPPSTDVERIFLSIDKIERECSWRPQVRLREGLASALLPISRIDCGYNIGARIRSGIKFTKPAA